MTTTPAAPALATTGMRGIEEDGSEEGPEVVDEGGLDAGGGRAARMGEGREEEGDLNMQFGSCTRVQCCTVTYTTQFTY